MESSKWVGRRQTDGPHRDKRGDPSWWMHRKRELEEFLLRRGRLSWLSPGTGQPRLVRDGLPGSSSPGCRASEAARPWLTSELERCGFSGAVGSCASNPLALPALVDAARGAGETA